MSSFLFINFNRGALDQAIQNSTVSISEHLQFEEIVPSIFTRVQLINASAKLMIKFETMSQSFLLIDRLNSAVPFRFPKNGTSRYFGSGF